MEICFLGTKAGGAASLDRHFSSSIVGFESTKALIDCGEGTQHQLLKAKVSWHQIGVIFITHLHGDHIHGLPGLLSSMDHQNRAQPLVIVGPVGIRTFANLSFDLCRYLPCFSIEYRELEAGYNGIVFENKDILVRTAMLNHGIESYGYRFDRNDRPHVDTGKIAQYGLTDSPLIGKILREGQALLPTGTLLTRSEILLPDKKADSITVLGDTAPCESAVELAEHTSLLVHEATFTEIHSQRAVFRGHSTAAQAAQIAARSSAGSLYLTHFSVRYPDRQVFLDEARAIFARSFLAHEFETASTASPHPRC